MQVCLMREPFEQELYEVPRTPEEAGETPGCLAPAPQTHCCPVGRLPAHPGAPSREEGVLEERGWTRGRQGALVLQPLRPPGQAPGLGDSALCLTGSFWSGVHGAPGQRTVGLRVSTQDCKNGVFALKAISVGTCHLWEDDQWAGDSGESVPPISPHQAPSHGLPSLLAPLTSLCDIIPLPSRDTTAPCDIIHSMRHRHPVPSCPPCDIVPIMSWTAKAVFHHCE